MILIPLCNLILSPFDKHNIILSSKTLFIFSTQKESTGPSKHTQYLYLGYIFTVYYLNNLLAIPSAQVYATLSKHPYNSSIVIAFGLKV